MTIYTVTVHVYNEDSEQSETLEISADYGDIHEDEDWGMYLMDDIRDLAAKTE